MKNLRADFERFCFRNKDKGIPNLMLYIVLGNAVVYLLSLFADNFMLYNILRFDRNLILQGQVWRLFSFVLASFTPSSSIFMMAISLLCYFSLGRAMENAWGTCKFNLFYLSGVLLMDIYAMAVGGILIPIGDVLYDCSSMYYDMGSYLNMSLFLAYATSYPDAQFLLFFIIPVKAWIFALIDLVLTLMPVFTYAEVFPHNLFPLIAIANYFLFFGKDVKNVIPVSWRANFSRLFRKKPKKQKTVPFPNAGSYESTTRRPSAPTRHECVICGRTEVSNPELEFRYCSRCTGYRCYCEDHINNHTHE